MGGLETWISVLGLPIASGVNLYATILVLGLSQRFGWLTGLPSELEILANPVVLGVAGFLYLVEFFADKIPYVDTLWDGLHTVIRPLGAAYLALQAVGEAGTTAQVLAMLAGAALGLGAHSTKAGTRLLVNTSPEPASNSIVSIVEDFGVVGLLVLMYSYPWVALGLVLALIGLMAVAAPLLFRMIRFLGGGVTGLIGNWFSGERKPLLSVPEWVTRLLPKEHGSEPLQVFEAYARNVAGVARFQRGYLMASPAGLLFAFRTLFRSGCAELSHAAPELAFENRLLFDVVSVESGPRHSRVCVAKNWSSSVQAVLQVTPAPAGSAAVEHR